MPGLLGNLFCDVFNVKPRADQYLEQYSDGLYGEYDPEDPDELAAWSCIDASEAWAVADTLSDGEISYEDVNLYRKKGYSEIFVTEMIDMFSLRELRDGYCHPASFHRFSWIANNVVNGNYTQSEQVALLNELESLSFASAPCAYRGTVGDRFLDAALTMLSARGRDVKEAAARASASIAMAAGSAERKELVADIVESEHLNLIIENAFERLEWDAPSFFDRVLDAAQEELDDKRYADLCLWIGDALRKNYDRAPEEVVQFLIWNIDRVPENTPARLSFEGVIRFNREDIEKRLMSGDDFGLGWQGTVTGLCREMGLLSLPVLAHIYKDSDNIYARHNAETELASMGFHVAGRHSEEKNEQFLIDIANDTEGLYAFIRAQAVLLNDMDPYIEILDHLRAGGKPVNDVLWYAIDMDNRYHALCSCAK